MAINSKLEKAVQQMEAWANDPSHGYDQIYRWGEYGDYDCSSSIIQALENAGIPAKSYGATYTGNMYNVLTALGFRDVTKEVDLINGLFLIRGDILLNHVNHVAMVTGVNRIVQASINEKGTATGGKPGDQTGKEFYTCPYYNYPWDCVLRYDVKEQKGTETKNDKSSSNKSAGTGTESTENYGFAIGRINKKSNCYLSPDTSQQSKQVPTIPKGLLVDIEYDDGTFALVGFCIPGKGRFKEYVSVKNISVIKQAL